MTTRTHLPPLHIIRRRRHETEFLGMHDHRAHGLLVVGQRGHRLPRDEIPQLDLTIMRSGDNLAEMARWRTNRETRGVERSCAYHTGKECPSHVFRSTSRGTRKRRESGAVDRNPTLVAIWLPASYKTSRPARPGRASKLSVDCFRPRRELLVKNLPRIPLLRSHNA